MARTARWEGGTVGTRITRSACHRWKKKTGFEPQSSGLDEGLTLRERAFPSLKPAPLAKGRVHRGVRALLQGFSAQVPGSDAFTGRPWLAWARGPRNTMPSTPRLAVLALVLVSLALPYPGQNHQHFESPQTNPARLSADRTRLFCVNTEDHRLSVFDVSNPSLPLLIQEIRAGVEPVSVCPRTTDEVWVVNHVSDSISVVSLALGYVVSTIAVPDEPCDVIFAGNPERAFVTASRSNAVHVIDVSTRTVVQTIALQGENPRCLATSADRSRVFAAFALSGNRTTTVPAASAPAQGPPTNPALPAPPQVGRIVDATDPAFAPSVIRYQVLDHDVVELNANTGAIVRYYDRAGTVNLGLAVSPTSGDVYVANTNARNLVRFETNLRGHVVDHRITRIVRGVSPTITPFDLNPGLNYALLPNPSALATSLAEPTGLVMDPSGTHLWLAAMGTDRIARIDAAGTVVARIDIGPATGSTVAPRTKRGPRGLALDDAAGRLYIQNRISNTLMVMDTTSQTVLVEVPIGAHDSVPTAIREGRGFLYDAKLSGNGTVSCSSCHVDGEVDQLAWDLGDPSGSMMTVTDPSGAPSFNVHPMKGPMVTQSMRGLAGTAPFHWRGDRADLAAFNPAFDKLMGGSQISASDMAVFTAFVDSITLHANPNLQLDRSFPVSIQGASPQTGLAQFQQVPSPTGNPTLSCSSCHSFPTPFTPRIRPQGPGQQPMDVPFMRGYYKKNHFSRALNAQNVIGFGLEHDGTVAPAILAGGNIGPLTAYFLSFDTGTAPAVGTQRTIHSSNATSTALIADLATLEAQANLGACDLIAHGLLQGIVRSLRFNPGTGRFEPDQSGGPTFSSTEIRTLALAGQASITVTGVLPGTGQRLARDRDADAILDGDEYGPRALATHAGCPGTGGTTPSLLGLGIPSGGHAFELRMASALPNAAGFLAAGLGDGAIPLAPGCTAHLDPLIPSLLTIASSPTGSASLGVVLPVGLPSQTLYFQAMFLDLGAAAGFSLTNTLELRID